jgi:hypothetical protein
MVTRTGKPADVDEAPESVNALRFLGGLLLIMALLLYFFHLAEAPMGQHTLGILSAIFAVLGASLLLLNRHKLRSMR